MNDYKIVIDPGHGGSDPGASGNGIVEKNLTLDISKYMYDRFRELGIPVSITRDSDITLSPSDRVNKILSFYGDDPNVIVISNHINAGGGDGAEVIYALRNSNQLATAILDELTKSGQNPRKVFQRRLPSDNSKDYYFIHRNTGVTEPVIVEYGFLDSNKDDVYQLKNNYNDYAEAVVRAVLEYINVDYQPITDNGIYVVKKGDSLWSIAKKYGLTVDEIKRYNNLDSNLLSIGQVLNVVKSNDVSSDVYVVKKDDTLYSIANRYGVNVNDLILYNNLSSDSLSIGDEIIIPIGQMSNENIMGDYDTYIVQPLDTLYGISNKFGVSIDEVRNINNLSSDILTVGQMLLVPKGYDIVDTDIINYVIKSGDTLYSIANKYGVSVNDLMQINNLISDNLTIGQILKIPYQEATVYTVKNGDTLYSIARKYNISVDELKEKNNLSNNIISVGQVLNVR